MPTDPIELAGGRSAVEHQLNHHGLSLRLVVNPGTSIAPPLLLMNGIGARLELMQPLVDALDPTRTLIRFDAPGIGGSPRSCRPYRLRRLVKALAAMLEELGYTQVDVLGLSWGGGVAQQFAFTQRAQCRRLVLVSTGTGSIMVPANPRILTKMLTPSRFTNPSRLLGGLGQELYGGSMRKDPTVAFAALKDQKTDTITTGYFLQLGSAAMWTSLFFLPLVRKRTLILAGDDDPLVPSINGQIMHRLMPKSELHIYEGGHVTLITEADELAPKIDAFLDAD